MNNLETTSADLNICDLHPVTLRFSIPSLEHKFNESYRINAKNHYRLVAIYILAVMVTLSITGVFMEFSVNPKIVQKLLWLAYIPLTVLVIGALSVPRLSRYSQHVVVLYVLLAGIIGIAFPRTQSAVFAMSYGYSYLMLICFLLFPLSRLKISYGLFLAVLLIFAYLIMLGTMADFSRDVLLRPSGWLVAATLFGLSIGYLIELNVRRWFLVHEKIRDREYQVRQANEKLMRSEAKLREEKDITESLLLSILPASIVDRLKVEGKAIVDGIVECTVLFSDLVGFTQIAQEIGPRQLVNLLSDLFSGFDKLSEKHGLEKIKTIGDAYMAAGGVPEYNIDHAATAADMALDMQEFIKCYNEENNMQLDIRIGLHTGPVIAGIIGTKKFSYDLWGDAVNMASRMESHSLPGKIQVTEATYLLLRKKFNFEERGFVEIKGKGKIKTYFLVSRNT